MFTLAMIQMRVEGGERAANLRRAAERVSEAAAAGAQVVVLPEAVNLGWTHRPEPGDEDRVPGGATCRELARMAKHCRVHLCAGLVETGEMTYNSAVLVDPTGEILLHHRKLNELEIAHDLYGQGESVRVAKTALGTIGLMICSDAFAPGQVISRALGHLGADIILSPCAWAVPADHDQVEDPYGGLWVKNYEPVARDYGIWIVGVSNVGRIRGGPWNGRRCIGCSLAVSPSGERTWGPYGVDAEAIIYLEVALEPRRARGDVWASVFERRETDEGSRGAFRESGPGRK